VFFEVHRQTRTVISTYGNERVLQDDPAMRRMEMSRRTRMFFFDFFEFFLTFFF
jgi:hypothetical protein